MIEMETGTCSISLPSCCLQPGPAVEKSRNTGHEHYDRFRIINANARLYDPVIGRFFSPDPFVQAPGFTQNYNRYSYCLNNPVMFTDPDGEFFIFDSWINGFIHGFATASENRWAAAWDEANKRAVNDARIWGGLFVSDPNKNFWGRSLEVVSRLTWQLPQTVAGWGFSQSCNTFGFYGGVETVEYRYGATVVQTNSNNWGAVTLGGYITGNNSIRADANNPLFQHEYGHYLQSQEMGWAYFPRVGIPSVLSSHDHEFHPVEQDANRRAFLYFNKHVDRFYKTKKEMSEKRGWDFNYNPLDIYGIQHGEYVDYFCKSSLQLLEKLSIHAKWYDYAGWLGFPFGPVSVGVYNSHYYNHQY